MFIAGAGVGDLSAAFMSSPNTTLMFNEVGEAEEDPVDCGQAALSYVAKNRSTPEEASRKCLGVQESMPHVVAPVGADASSTPTNARD